ncbi:tRNA lysidine(34) synthetase TilS [Salinicola rhizosphaerae]|uniref:tRNA(Ile)-lysidine synthase n=1 Tax=Salinicola rhizosphaerae TaxID=1443141 RepID=A0ABQ3DY71_9GAMM|nr:tRNA lysidine(34) synthetase TilS [Salinicola rhizosphaerae]GHB20207.1 tRNA(Ile)-lysidine synthase [Salinicola rhizosphaerae]
MTPDRLVDDALALCAPVRRVWVALSGGMDSSLLLEIAAPLARARGLSLHAIHINHGLQPAAVDFEAHCRALCARLAVPLTVEPVEVVTAGEGWEAAARTARYRAFRSRLQAGDSLLLAQHGDDQAETFLLAALRGSGVRGLAAMPSEREDHGIVIRRPWLSLSRSQLVQEAATRELAWVEDPTNADAHFDRNYLRLRVLPAMRERWPHAASAVAQSAAWQQEAEGLLAELAALDLAAAGGDPARLALAPLMRLSASRRRLLVRHALDCLGLPSPPGTRLAEIDRQLQSAGQDRQVHIDWPGAEARRWGGHLYLMAPPVPVEAGWRLEWDGCAPLETPWGRYHLVLSRQGEGNGERNVARPFRVTLRRGGERLRLPERGERDLKRLLQELEVPSWERARLPLIWHGEELVAVPGLLTATGWRQRCASR